MAGAALAAGFALAAAFLGAALAVAFFGAAFAGAASPPFAADARLRAGSTVPALGSFTLPATMSLNNVPGRNDGTLVFFTFTASPVRGLRAIRAARSRFSKTPKPEIDTLRPALTSRCTRSMKPSIAADASLLSPSN